MLVAWKDWELTTDFDKILTFSVARGFDLVLSLDAMTPLKTPAIGMNCPRSVGKDCFDMLKSIEIGVLIGLFGSLRQSDRVFFG